MQKSVLRNILYTLATHPVLSFFFSIYFVVVAIIVIIGTMYVSVCFINRKASVLLNRFSHFKKKPKHNGFIYLTEFH